MKKQTLILTNAFSINMLNGSCHVGFVELKLEETVNIVNGAINIKNTIGHANTDALIRNLLETNGAKKINAGERSTVSLNEENPVFLVAQYTGPRLEEGCKKLPENAAIKFWLAILK